MVIAPISVGDVESISKINQAIAKANLVDNKAEKAEVASETAARERADIGIPVQHPVHSRPGDAPQMFVTSRTGGDPSLLPSVNAALVKQDDRGRVIRLTGDALVATRGLYPIEPGKKYLVEYAVQRRVNSPDPDNDAIRCALAWYDQVQHWFGQVVVQDLLGLTTGSGRRVVTAVVSTSSGDGIDIVAPANARYCRPYVQGFGTLVQNDVEVIRWEDITSANAYSPDLTALESRASALESVDAGPRLDELESQVTAPNTVRYATMGDLLAAAVPVTADAVELLGYYAAGDGGGHIRSRAISTDPAVLQSNDGAYWVVAEKNPSIRLKMFGAVGDDAEDAGTNDRATFLAAKAWVAANPGRALAVSDAHWLSETLTDISGLRIVAEPGARFRGNIDLEAVNVDCPSDLEIKIDSAGIVYPYKIPRGFKRPFAEKGLWLGAGDLVRDTYTRIDPGTLIKEKIDWPSDDTWETDSLPIASGETISWNLTAGGVWHAALRPAVGAREMTAWFSPGDYTRGAFIRYSGGYVLVHAALGGATIAIKNIGSSIATSSLTWRGSSDHPQWLAANSAWGVRVYDERTAAFTINGTEVYRFTLPIGSLITEYGFGVFASASAIVAGISRWTERSVADTFGGQQQVVISVFGDSEHSDFIGVWTDALREALDGTFGIRCVNVLNYAVPGTNSLSVLNAMEAEGLGISNYVFIGCGTNNVQQNSPLSASIANLEDMLDIVAAAGRRAIVALPGLWFNADQTADGFYSVRAEFGAELREAYRTTAASYGALIIDELQIGGQILADFVTSPDLSDPRLRDNLHKTPFFYRLYGQHVAGIVAGDIAMKATPAVQTIGLPTRYFSNSWYASIQAPRLTVTAERDVMIDGILEPGTKTDGTAIMNLPSNLRPNRTMRYQFRAYTGGGTRTFIRGELWADGALSIYDVPSDTSYILIDGLMFRAA